MQGLAENTKKIFESVSSLNCIKDYTLIGGTALSLQINKRLSEDLDFCKWSKNLRTDKPTVDWPQIERELKTIGSLDSRDIFDFDQVNFVVSGVKISFLAKKENLSPVTNPVAILNNIKAADLEAIGAMKVEIMLRRTEWRDYYDIYSILREGKSLKSMVTLAGKYSNHKLKTRDALNFLINGKNYKKAQDFQLLMPAYNIDSREIEELILSKMKQEYI
jgi:predicted nucleotidyltransferase component of viral defense system